MKGVQIISTGSALPSKIINNTEIAEAVGSTDEWIFDRTGVSQRRYCSDEENCLELAYEAASSALNRSGLNAEDIGLCIAATFTPEYATPATACMIQSHLGIPESCASFDLNAACSGFIYAVEMARCYMHMNDVEYALITGCEKFSDLLDMSDYGTAILFGDGAGAAVIKKSDSLYHNVIGSNGSKVIWMKGVGPEPAVLHMEGRPVFKFATVTIEHSVKELLEKSGLSIDEIDHFVFHQANARIIDFVVKRMKLSPEKVYKNMDRLGNTSAASIPILLDELASSGCFHKGDKIIMAGFGSGLTWAAMLIEW